MTELLFDDDDDEELPDTSLAWSRKLIVGEAYDRPKLGDTGPDDLQRAEMQFRREGPPAPVLFDDGDGMWGPCDLFATAIGVNAESLTLEAAEEWLVERYASR